MEGLASLGRSLAAFLQLWPILLTLGATLVGILIGCMPGLSATLGIALLTTLTIKMPPNEAILILISAYIGAIYGGSRTAILLNIPGTAANAAACLDGYALARQGQAGRAMGIATTGSVIGSLFGIVCLALFTPLLGEVALSFGAFEFFWLAVFGVMMSGQVTGEDALKGWIMGFVGLLVALIGQDGIHAYDRFTFGITDLGGGFSLIPVLVGVFGFAEVLTAMKDKTAPPAMHAFDSVLPRIADVLRYWKTVLRSGVIGVYVGILPGVGEDMAAWSSYAAARRASKEREKFGKGSIEGLIAAETGDNASIPGAIIPALALGHPGLGAGGGAAGGDDHPRRAAGAAADGRAAAVRLRRGRDVPAGDAGDPVLRPVPDSPDAAGAAHPAQHHHADHLRAVRGRLLRHRAAAVRRLDHARLRRRRLLPAPARLSHGAVRARHRARRHSRQEPAPRPGAVRRQPRAVLHAADLPGAVAHHRRVDPAADPAGPRPLPAVPPRARPADRMAPQRRVRGAKVEAACPGRSAAAQGCLR